MDELKRPSKFVAVLFTISAVCSLISLFLLLVGQNAGTGQILFQILTVTLLLIAAIANWHVYAKRYVNYEVQRQLKGHAAEAKATSGKAGAESI